MSDVSKMYRSAFKLPSIWSRDVRVVCPMAARTITLGAGPLCRYHKQACDVRSPRSLQTCTWLSENSMQNRDSPKKKTLCHSCIQFCPGALVSPCLPVLNPLISLDGYIRSLTCCFLCRVLIYFLVYFSNVNIMYRYYKISFYMPRKILNLMLI